MTTVAWDSFSIAVDRQGDASGLRQEVRKYVEVITPSLPHTVLAWTGGVAEGLLMAKWYVNGLNHAHRPPFDDFPAFQNDKDRWARLIVATEKNCIYFEQSNQPNEVRAGFWAWGSGADLAMGAMAMGATAEQAVKIASEYDIYTGMGIDVFTLKKNPVV